MDNLKDIRFDWNLDPRILRQHYKDTRFDDLFYGLISKGVIDVLSPQLVQEPHNLIYDEDRVQKHLLSPLERFICKSPENDVAEIMTKLTKLEQPNKMCRKVLKAGDVLFSCNDCGFDATCVVCIDCFHKSEHKNHNYRMSNTEGGGCCDCGDVEAWKQFPACSEHMVTNKPNLKLSDFEDQDKRMKQIDADRARILEKISSLPDDGMASRYFLICQACLHYARDMLTWSNFSNLPRHLEFNADDYEHKDLLSKEETSKNFFTVLFNDEVHTYDHVINTLVKVIKCSKMTASIMASSVSREGRSFILQDRYEQCKQAKNAIASIRDSGQGPLKVSVIHGAILAHQAYALKLLVWIKNMATTCDAFRILTAYTLLGEYDPIVGQEDNDESEHWSLLEKVMLSNTSYWKMARIEWNDLFVATLLTEYSIKEKFARLTTRLYSRLVNDYIKDDHDHSVSAMTMTTQLYTVPSLVCMLIEEENALAIISRNLVKVLSMTRRDSTTMGLRYAYDSMKRGFSIISDFKHLINIEPTLWTLKLRVNAVLAVTIFLELLHNMQSMDPVKRQLGQHLEYEPDWETGITLQMRLIPLVNTLITYCAYDKFVLSESLRETQLLLFKNLAFKKISRELYGYQASCIQYDVSTSPVSVHLPLTRFAAALIIELMRRRPSDTIPYDESLVILVENNSSRESCYYLRAAQNDASAVRQHSVINIMEHSLRTLVMVAQFRSGMWRRNGSSLINQILYYSGPLMRKEMFDRDILCIQECAAMCEANTFIIHLVNKFNLFTWVSSETTREPLVGPKAVSFYNDEEILAHSMSLGEEFLQLLLTIIGERYHVGIGKIEEDDVVKHEIIQLLCIQPYTRSEIEQKLYVSDNELNCIKLVANLRRTSENAAAKYELKEEYYQRFNPFYYHYNRRQQSLALDAQLKRKRNLKETLICCPPPRPVELTEQFKNLNELLKCELTLRIIEKNLRRALGPPEGAQECSTKAPIRFTASHLQFDQCLHLIGLGLYEQERDPIGFNYLMATHKLDIYPVLKDCYEKAHRSKDLIYWIFEKTNGLIELLKAIHSNNLDEQQSEVYENILLCISSILSKSNTLEQEDRRRNKENAAKRRERITAMMKAKQEKFLANPTTKQLAEETAEYETPPPPAHQYPASQVTNTTNTTTTTTASSDMRATHNDPEDKMEVEASDNESSHHVATSKFCIVCREEQYVTFDGHPMIMLAYIQRSTVLSKNRDRKIPHYCLTPTNQLKHLISSNPDLKLVGGSAPEKYSYTSDNSWSFDASFMPSDLFFGPHISTCGHFMHHKCWHGFTDAIIKREMSRPNRAARHVSFELNKNEILCPLCDFISNAVIPILPEYNNFALEQARRTKPFGIGVFSCHEKDIDKSSDNLAAFLHAIKSTVITFKHVRTLPSAQQLDVPLNFQRQIKQDQEEKYVHLLQPAPINEALSELDESEALALRDFVATIKAHKISSSKLTNLLLSIVSSLAERIHIVGLDVDSSIVDINHERVFMMTSWAISYTIQAHERYSRFKGTPLFEDINSDKYSAMTYLTRCACLSMATHQSNMIQSILVRKLRYLLVSEEHLMASPCCLDIDALELFISIFIMLQKLYSHLDDTSAWTTRAYDHEFHRNLLHLVVMLNMLQVIVSMQSTANQESTESTERTQSSAEETTEECIVLKNFYENIVFASGHPTARLPQGDKLLVQKVKRAMLPFLRSCAIFFYHLTGFEFDDTLKTHSAFNESKEAPDHIDYEASDLEYVTICNYLSLPSNFAILLRNQETRNLVRMWSRHSRVSLLLTSQVVSGTNTSQTNDSSGPSSSTSNASKQCLPAASSTKSDLIPLKLVIQPHLVNRLIDLPYDYSELVDRVSNFTCPSIKNEDARTPTMCLVCGAMLCSQSYCCQRDLNNLAANYQQIVERHDELRQLLNEAPQLRARASQRDITNSGEQGGSSSSSSSSTAMNTLLSLQAASPSMFQNNAPFSLPLINQQLVGSCTYHAYECSGGVGIFLRIRNCQILLLSKKSKGCYLPAPYVDDHGETDYGLMRGNPMHLDAKQYEKWQSKWMAHEIPEKISRFLEHSTHASNINWHLH